MPLPMNLKDLLDCTGKLGRFKQGPMASALRHQKELLNGLKAFIPWSQQLSERRQQLLMETVVDTTAKIFKKVGQKLQLGPTVTIPRANATAVSAGVIRKTFLAAGRVLKATEALVVDWDKEDEEDMLSEDEEEKEEHDSPPKRKRPPKHVSFSPEPSTKQHSSPATSSRRAKASGRVRRAYHAALRIAKAVEEFPHALGDEIEWSIRPGACSDIADHVTGDCEIATLDDLEDARGLRACVPGEENWLEEIPSGKALLREDTGPGASEKVANNDSIGKQRGVLDAAAKAFNGDYFSADLVQHASVRRGIRQVHQRIASSFVLSWNPDMLDATWTRFIQARRDAGQTTSKTAGIGKQKIPAGAKTTSKPKSSILSCFQWNAGKCTKKGCKFPHVRSSCGGDHRKKDNASIGFDRRGRDDRPTPVDLLDDTVQRGVSTSDTGEPALSSWGASSGLTPRRIDVAGVPLLFASECCPAETLPAETTFRVADSQWSFPPVYSQEGEFLHPCDTLGEKLWSPPDFKPRSQRFGELLSSREPKWGELDLSSHGVSLEAWRAFKSATTAIGAAVLVVTERVDRWAMLFRDDPRVDALVRSVAHGAGWQFDPARVDMSGENYVKAGFEHKVDEIHEEELRLKRVVPIPSHLAEAVHGVGVVDKDHSNFEKVRVVHNYSENEDWSVNSATDIPEQKWQSAADAMAFLRPEVFHDQG
eukprot:gene21312-biopygen21978